MRQIRCFTLWALLALVAVSAAGCDWFTKPGSNRKIGVGNDSRYTIHSGLIQNQPVISDCGLAISDWFICRDRYCDGTWIDYTFSAADPTVYTMHGRFKLPGTTTKFHNSDVSAKIIIGHGVSFSIMSPQGHIDSVFVRATITEAGKVVQLGETNDDQP